MSDHIEHECPTCRSYICSGCAPTPAESNPMTPDKTPSEAELLPCPFCGEAAKHSFNSLYGDMSMASCKSCGATAYAPKWNRRAVLAKGGSPVVAGEPTVKYVPVKADLRDKHWNHPRDDEPRTEACRKALRDRGDDEGQGLDGYWKWGFAAGFNAELATTPQPTQAQAGAVPLTDEQIKDLQDDGVFLGTCRQIVRAIEAAHGIKRRPAWH